MALGRRQRSIPLGGRYISTDFTVFWHQIGSRPSTTTTLTLLWLMDIIVHNHVRKQTYRIAAIEPTVWERGQEVSKSLVSLLQAGYTPRTDFSRYWPFVRGIHRSPVNSPHKGQWRGALMCGWTNGWVNNGEAGDLRRHRAHYDVTVMEAEMIDRSQLDAVTGGGKGRYIFTLWIKISKLEI